MGGVPNGAVVVPGTAPGGTNWPYSERPNTRGWHGAPSCFDESDGEKCYNPSDKPACGDCKNTFCRILNPSLQPGTTPKVTDSPGCPKGFIISGNQLEHKLAPPCCNGPCHENCGPPRVDWDGNPIKPCGCVPEGTDGYPRPQI